jgi:hypothetical protein
MYNIPLIFTTRVWNQYMLLPQMYTFYIIKYN